MDIKYEKIKDLREHYISRSNGPENLQVVRNRDTQKFSLYNTRNQTFVTDEYTELDVVEDGENIFLLINDNGKCGIYDYSLGVWAYKPDYEGVRLIKSENSVQRKEGITYMCVLEVAGYSGLFTFTKNNEKIIDRQTLVPIDNYNQIYTNLFTNKRKVFSSNVRGEECINRMLFVELKKASGTGCVVIKNNQVNLPDGTNMGGEFDEIMNVPCEYETIRPSEFDGQDGYIPDTEEAFSPDDVYLYEKIKNTVGKKNGACAGINKSLCLNDINVISMLEQKLLLCSKNHLYGVIHNGELIINTKYSPQFIKEDIECGDEYKTRFTTADIYGNVYQISSRLGDWKKGEKIKVMTRDEYTQNQKNELF